MYQVAFCRRLQTLRRKILPPSPDGSRISTQGMELIDYLSGYRLHQEAPLHVVRQRNLRNLFNIMQCPKTPMTYRLTHTQGCTLYDIANRDQRYNAQLCLTGGTRLMYSFVYLSVYVTALSVTQFIVVHKSKMIGKH